MQRVLFVTRKIFNDLFTGNWSPFKRIIVHIINEPFLVIGVVLIIIGFSIGLLKRVINS